MLVAPDTPLTLEAALVEHVLDDEFLKVISLMAIFADAKLRGLTKDPLIDLILGYGPLVLGVLYIPNQGGYIVLVVFGELSDLLIDGLNVCRLVQHVLDVFRLQVLVQFTYLL